MSHLLFLRKILNNHQSIDFQSEWAQLGKDDDPAILIYGGELSTAVLKCPKIIPANLVEYCYGMLGLKKGTFPNIENLFSNAPLFLYGNNHLNSRKIFAQKYKDIERDLVNWLPNLTQQFINANKSHYDPINIAQQYVNLVFRNIAARDLEIDEITIPVFPDRFFTLYPSKEKLNGIEEQLGVIKHFYESRLKELKREAIDAQILMAMNVVGGEPLEAALCYGLFNLPLNQSNLGLKEFFHAAAPVNFFGRIVSEDVIVNEIIFKKNQEIFICPNLIHQHLLYHHNDSDTSYSFGKGLHKCLGQSISMEMAKYFFSEIICQKFKFPKLEMDMKFVRDNINLRITTKEKIYGSN